MACLTTALAILMDVVQPVTTDLLGTSSFCSVCWEDFSILGAAWLQVESAKASEGMLNISLQEVMDPAVMHSKKELMSQRT